MLIGILCLCVPLFVVLTPLSPNFLAYGLTFVCSVIHYGGIRGQLMWFLQLTFMVCCVKKVQGSPTEREKLRQPSDIEENQPNAQHQDPPEAGGQTGTQQVVISGRNPAKKYNNKYTYKCCHPKAFIAGGITIGLAVIAAVVFGSLHVASMENKCLLKRLA